MAIKDDAVYEITYETSGYVYTYSYIRLDELRGVYPYRKDRAKPRWQLELKRIEAIKRSDYP